MWKAPRTQCCWCLLLLAVSGSVSAAPQEDLSDEQTLKAAGLQTDNGGLLRYFREHTLSRAGQDHIHILIRQLGDDAFRTRARASAELVALGTAAVPFLERASRDRDLEVAQRADQCLRLIHETNHTSGLTAAAARLLARRNPPGATEVLLEYLPFAENDCALDEVQAALAVTAIKNGKPEKVLVAALKDPELVRRAGAAEILTRHGNRDAVPVLIALLDQLPLSQARRTEDMLIRLAGDKAPPVSLGREQETRRRCRDAWLRWWQDNGARTDLARLQGFASTKGYTLLVMLDAGRVVELDEKDRPRFQIDGLELPLDAQMLPDDHVLITEHNANRVAEWTKDGKVVWTKQADRPLMAQRLPNGHTFIGTQTRLYELDREGKEVFSYARPNGRPFMKAAALPDGEIVYITQDRRFYRMDRKGKELESFPVNVTTSGGRAEVLPGGHVLIPEMAGNRVAEYNADGKLVWQAAFQSPVAAVHLPNSHVLVTSYNQPRAVELDRTGKEVWEYRGNTRITRAFRR